MRRPTQEFGSVTTPTPEQIEAVKPYTPVLMRMVDLLNENERLPMGEALARAEVECGFGEDKKIPEDVRNAMLVSAFRIVTGGFPGAAEA